MTLDEYIGKLNAELTTNEATEHSYRGHLKALLEGMNPALTVTNEPKRSLFGAPDYVIKKGVVPIGGIEAKDIGKNLDEVEGSEQLSRYRIGLDNLILTDYFDFRFFRNGDKIASVRIAALEGGRLKPMPENFQTLTDLLKDFLGYHGVTIRSSSKLADLMADKARLVRNDILAALRQDGAHASSLFRQFDTFRQALIHDLTVEQFSDIYAQTIAYGMFAARLHDTTLESFTREESVFLIPRSNPLLQQMFHYIAGPQLDERLVWVVERLADVFAASDVAAILDDFDEASGKGDPMIHFYESFLTHYDPEERKRRGVWYTPQPLVRFIVRAIDDTITKEFGLPDGLADTSKIIVKVDKQGHDARTKSGRAQESLSVPRVQILDPATGTGTFLAEVIRVVHERIKRSGQEGFWSPYVENDLIPRLIGFELLMASYAMAHTKLELLLTKLGYRPDKGPRLKVFLTNSLEPPRQNADQLFVPWLADEAASADRVKREAPIMVVLGNPPYSAISTNNDRWIAQLIDDYKYVDGKYFDERKHWLNDDYVKFIRFAEHHIEKNGSGVVGYVTNHGYLDNPTFRGMREHLLKSFDRIFVLDLHGNAKKKEVAPGGGKDENVFGIQQGVAIIIAVKTGAKKKKTLGELSHAEIYGKKEDKFAYLNDRSLATVVWKKLTPASPQYWFVPRDDTNEKEYEEGFRLNELMPESVTGVVTARDAFVIDFDEETLRKRMENFADPARSDDETRAAYFGRKKSGKYPPGDSRGWKLAEARKKLFGRDHRALIRDIAYRPFDDRKIYYSPDMVDWGREKFMRHMQEGNVGLVSSKINRQKSLGYFWITDKLLDFHILDTAGDSTSIFPLYLYPEQQSIGAVRVPNFDPSIVKQIAKRLGLPFVSEKGAGKDSFAPVDILDYVYAVLHAPSYREKFKQFLKSDFPRVPYPVSAFQFFSLVEKGSALRALHLLASDFPAGSLPNYPAEGSNRIDAIRFEPGASDVVRGRVFINDTQYFDNAPVVAWELYVGGYRPAYKWLNDRKGRTLTKDDVTHYQRLTFALSETVRLMGEIDTVYRG